MSRSDRSSQVNDAVDDELTDRRHRLLGEMLEDYERTAGPVNEDLVTRYMDLLA